MSISKLRKELKELSSPEKAKILQKFFKTGKGEYGEGDVFFGITVPEQRKVAIKYWNSIGPSDIQILLNSQVHEERLVGLLILVKKYEKNEIARNLVYDFYLENTKNVNNWDLVDLSAPNIVGKHLLNKDRKILYKLAKSENLWEKRISIISTFTFIREKDFSDTLKISEILLNDKHDLIHKAVGWMLREVGKRDEKVLKDFLKKYYKIMPRTMLRYAIEKFDEKIRKKYLEGKV